MPELPEVETTLRGIIPHMLHKKIKCFIIRNPNLRWPIPSEINLNMSNQIISSITRRGKYLLFETRNGYMILHLGMSGRLHIVPTATPPKPHDHVDIILSNDLCCRYYDPRRFGCMLWTDSDPLQHKLLKKLGPEPLTEEFNTVYIYQASRERKVGIKQFIMNSQIVVGVGNIYANEALFFAGIHPSRQAGRISYQRYEKLVAAIKQVLTLAIADGGTTLRDFFTIDGQPGYFKQSLAVYGRAEEPCVKCKRKLIQKNINQRTTVFCSQCQR